MLLCLFDYRPCQFWVMWQNMRCSTLFQLLVPGGKWHTWIGIPRRTANACTATLHERHRLPLLPPPSARDQHFFGMGIALGAHLLPLPADGTANCAVS